MTTLQNGLKRSWPKEIKTILWKGLPLYAFGVDNWALKKDQAILAIDELEKLEVPILGGDVYQETHDAPEATYDNWYCDRLNGEELEAFVTRSSERARIYLQEYENPMGHDILFVLVPGIDT